MNYQESREYIDRVTREIPSVLGLEHMRELMKRLGNPQEDLKYVHIAGTNGKGSVIAFLYSTLSQAGYCVGRYVSPTLYSYRGRIAVAGQMIDRDSFALYLTQVADAIQVMTADGFPHPTAFEIEKAVILCFLKWEWVETLMPPILSTILFLQFWYLSVWIICLFLEIPFLKLQRKRPELLKRAVMW